MQRGTYAEAVAVFDKYVLHNRDTTDFADVGDMMVEGNDILFGLKAKCFAELLERAAHDEDAEMVRHCMQQIHEAIPYQRGESGLSASDFTLAELQLRTKLMANGFDNDDAEALRFFERKMKDKSLWCIRKNHHKRTLQLLEMAQGKQEDDLMVGVHLYANATAKFVLNYVFRHKLGDGSCFAQGTAIPIVIGKSLRFDEVRCDY